MPTSKVAHPCAPDQDTSNTYAYAIRNTDTDFRQRLQVSSLFALMQEAAYFNAEELGIGATHLDSLRMTWMLSRISVRLDYLPSWGEPIWIKTWSRGPRKLLFDRDFLFYAGSTGAVPFGRATSEWLIASVDSHRPQRPEQVLSQVGLIAAPTGLTPALDAPCPRLLSMLDSTATHTTGSTLAPRLIKYADFSEIDRNRHVNNTRYIAWSMDTAYADVYGGLQGLDDSTLRGLDLRELDINYLAEIRPSERVHLFANRTLSSDRTDSVPDLQVEGLKAESGQSAFRARLRFSSLDPC